MRIALISFEFPPTPMVGGIGTYSENAADMLSARGHHVEVFCARVQGMAADLEVKPYPVHRISCQTREVFRELLPSVFTERHKAHAFDLVESPEVGAEGVRILRDYPSLPHVVRLHTCRAILSEDGWAAPPPLVRLRFVLSGLIRGRHQDLARPPYKREEDNEYAYCRAAHALVAPSAAMARRIERLWALRPESVPVIHNVFTPKSGSTPPVFSKRGVVLGFVGRMEERKGFNHLIAALKHCLPKCPELQALFIGPAWPLPFTSTNSQEWAAAELRKYQDRIHFAGAVPSRDVPSWLRHCDFVVLPSKWEAFGYVCAEAMAAGVAVVASRHGGMAELIDDEKTGVLVTPEDKGQLTRTIEMLARNPEQRKEMANAGKESIGRLLSPERIAPLQEQHYRETIQRVRAQQ